MDIGLIDVDNRDRLNNCFPNLALMKLSSWHKAQGDSVQWYEPLEMKHYDRVYMSKVFSFTEDFPFYVDADEVMRGGSGYCISLVDGKEVYDRFQDKEMIEPRFRTLKEVTGWERHKVTVYVLCGFDTTMEQNLDRIMFLRSLDFQPYVMLYDKEHIPRGHELKSLQRWVNSPNIFWSVPTFAEYTRRRK